MFGTWKLKDDHSSHLLLVPKTPPVSVPLFKIEIRPSKALYDIIVFEPRLGTNDKGGTMGKTRLGTRKAATNKVEHMRILRQLQTDQCAVNIALNTTYNANKDVVPFVGIMFSVFAKTPLDILTMELDIRFGDDTDLSVEVYSYSGRFDLIFDDPIYWTLVANTTAVRAPEGTGAIIPVSDFDTVSIGKLERRSFYITMKAPILQYNVEALVKTDEVALQNADIALFAGVGFSEYKFPEAIDTLVDPQFTGVLHYARKATCGQVSSTVDYAFILDKRLLVGVLDDFTRQVNAAVTDLMQKDSGLQVLQETHGLQKDGDAQTATDTYSGKCPNEECSLLLITSVSFVHDDSLRSGELIYSLYQFADAITKVVGKQMSGVKVIYVGPRDVAATYGIVLGGVPRGETMDAVQQEYFADVTVEFLSGSSGGDRVLDLQIDEQIDRNDGSIQVIGKLLGASYQPVAAFANGLESSFREGQDEYVQKLIQDRLRPNAINEIGGIEFFEGISSVGGTVAVDPDAANRQVNDGGGNSSNSMLIIAIASAVGGIALIIILCWYCWTRRKSMEERREVQRYRERMKVERRARREDGKETLLGQDDDPEDACNYREGIASTSDEVSDGQNGPSSNGDDRPSTLADFPENRNDSGQRTIPEDSSSVSSRKKTQRKSAKISDDDLPDSAECFEDGELFIEDSQKPDAALGTASREVEVAEDVPPRTPGNSLKKPQPQSSNTEDDGLSSSRKRVPPKPSKSMDSYNEFLSTSSPRKRAPPKPSNSMDSNQFLSQAPVVPLPTKPEGASPAALSKFMKGQPKTPANKLSGSRSVQLPPPLSPTSKKVKEAEDVPRGSPRKQPPVRGNTKSLDERDFKGELSQNTRVPPLGKINESTVTSSTASGAAKPKGASPAELSRFMKEQPKASADKLSGSRSVQYQPPATLGPTPKKVKEAEDVPSGSPRKRPPVRGNAKSLDESDFKSDLRQNTRESNESSVTPKTASGAPTPSKPMGASPAALSRFMKVQPKTSTDNLSGSRSVELPPSECPTSKMKKVNEAEDILRGGKRPPVRGNTKSLDESDFKGDLRQNTRGKMGASPVSPERAQPQSKPPTRTYQPPGALGPTAKVTATENVPTGSPRRRLPVRGASQSLDDSSFRKKLSPLAVPLQYQINHGKDRLGDASMTAEPSIIDTGLQRSSPLSPVKPSVRP